MTTIPTLGTIRLVDGRGAIRMDDRFATDVHDLWSAITERDRLARWIAVIDGDLQLGGGLPRPLHQWVGRARANRTSANPRTGCWSRCHRDRTMRP